MKTLEKYPWLLLLIIPGFVVLLFAGSGLFRGLEKALVNDSPVISCEFSLSVPVYGTDGLITTVSSPPLKTELVLNEGSYELEELGTEWDEFYSSIDIMVGIANNSLAPLFYSGANPPAVTFQKLVKFRQAYSPQEISSGTCEQVRANYQDSIIESAVYVSTGSGCDKKHQYCTKIHTVEEWTHVTVTSPGGSYVKYVIPSLWFDQALRHAFLGEDLFVFEPQFYTSETVFGQTEYGQELLNSLFSGNTALLGEEVISFKFEVDDFEGRKALPPALLKALEVSAAQVDAPVAFMAQAMLTGGQFETGEVSIDTSNKAVSFLFYHSSETKTEYKQTTQLSYKDLLSGSVFMPQFAVEVHH